MMKAEDINSIESESGIIASLIHNPELSFYSEYLLPNHFTNKENRCIWRNSSMSAISLQFLIIHNF